MGAEYKAVVVTNNPSINCSDVWIEVRYHSSSAHEVLQEAQQLIFNGYKLLTHPLGGNWQMNESPYKTLLLKKAADVDSYSAKSISRCMMWLSHLPRTGLHPHSWPHETLPHYQYIDMELFANALTKYKASPETY